MKTNAVVFILATALSFSCSQKSTDQTTLLSPKGMNSSGQKVPALSSSQEVEFEAFIQDSGRLDATAPVLNVAQASRPKNLDSKSLAILTKMQTGNCVVAQTQSKSSEPYANELIVSGSSCPVTMNTSFTTTATATGSSFQIASDAQVTDADLQTTNDIISQNMKGSGTETVKGSGGDVVKEVVFAASGTSVSTTKGTVTITRKVLSHIHWIPEGVESGRSEEFDEFQFKNYSVVVQSVFSKHSKKSASFRYYINGVSMSAADYKNLMGAWGLEYQFTQHL